MEIEAESGQKGTSVTLKKKICFVEQKVICKSALVSLMLFISISMDDLTTVFVILRITPLIPLGTYLPPDFLTHFIEFVNVIKGEDHFRSTQ